MRAPDTAFTGLKNRRPEWQPWLAVVEEILREIETCTWDATVPTAPDTRQHTMPLLAGAAVAVQASAVRRLFERLIRTALLSDTPKIATLQAALDADLDVLTLFAASLCQDSDRVNEVAMACGADEEALRAVAGLVSMPLLHACNRRWAASISESWVEGYCPVCAAWPAFAEVRGIERRRYFRCGRCGGEWHAHMLHCPYCAMNDHDELVALVPEKAGSHAVIEACKRCRGYVKTSTTLQGCPAGTVLLEDLASVELDVAALEQGYTRPPGAGYPLEVTVADKGTTRRLFPWKA